MHMSVFTYGSKTPIVIETNLAWAIPYWMNRRRFNPNLRWTFT